VEWEAHQTFGTLSAMDRFILHGAGHVVLVDATEARELVESV
jgi:hypothetical protein